MGCEGRVVEMHGCHDSGEVCSEGLVGGGCDEFLVGGLGIPIFNHKSVNLSFWKAGGREKVRTYQ